MINIFLQNSGELSEKNGQTVVTHISNSLESLDEESFEDLPHPLNSRWRESSNEEEIKSYHNKFAFVLGSPSESESCNRVSS